MESVHVLYRCDAVLPRFEIAVQDLAIVHVLHCEQELNDPFNDLRLGNALAFLLVLLNLLVQISALKASKSMNVSTILFSTIRPTSQNSVMMQKKSPSTKLLWNLTIPGWSRLRRRHDSCIASTVSSGARSPTGISFKT